MSKRRRQPETIVDLLAPDRVWVTPCGCWLWLGGDDGNNDPDGMGAYGRVNAPGTRTAEPVHRYVYKKFKGPIPPGYDVDHICAKWQPDPRVSRKCVNLDHLQAVPPHINQQLKLLRRLGYGTDELDLDGRPHRTVPPMGLPVLPPILAPGESEDDLCMLGRYALPGDRAAAPAADSAATEGNPKPRASASASLPLPFHNKISG